MRTYLPAILLLTAAALSACAPLRRRVPPTDPVSVDHEEPRVAPPTAPRAPRTQATPVRASLEQQAPADSAGLGSGAPPDSVVATPAPAELNELYADAQAAHEAGRFDDALEDWERAWKRDPSFADVEDLLVGEYLVRGLEFFAEGELTGAILYWEMAQKIRPADVRVRAYLERAREQQAGDLPLE